MTSLRFLHDSRNCALRLPVREPDSLIGSPRSAGVETPFKADVGGRACIVHAGAEKFRIEHGAGCVEVPYSAVRCVQRSGRRVVVNAEAGGALVSYFMDAPGARRLCELLLGGCGASSESSGAGSRERNSNRHADPPSSHSSESREPDGERPIWRTARIWARGTKLR